MQRIFGKRYQPSLTSAALPRGLALASPTLAQVDNPTDDPPQNAGGLERALACGGLCRRTSSSWCTSWPRHSATPSG